MKRSKWKGFYTKPADFTDTSKSMTRISRSSSIIPKFIEKTFSIHNGKKLKNITITKEMLGHKFGEFSNTRIPFEFKKKKKKKK
jgi:ribosomal protein S19